MKGLAVAALLLAGCSTCEPRQRQGRERFRRVDVHVHVDPAAVPRLLKLMDAHGIDVAVNLSGGWPGAGLEASLAAARATSGRVVVFATLPLWALERGATVPQLVEQLELAHAQGARGLKIFKALGLSARWPDGSLIAIDDARLDPLFERAGALGLPVAIHSGDPKAFWLPVTPENERVDELTVHPDWSAFGKPVPSWDALYQAFLRRVERHPTTRFIGVHFGNAPEDPKAVALALERLPNLFVDTAARVPELGRHDPAALRELFVRFHDRILFGTDLGVGVDDGDVMLGSTGATAPTAADVTHFFSSTDRFFETSDRDFAHPTPIQGRWRISGIALPREVLRDVYARNADRLLAR